LSNELVVAFSSTVLGLFIGAIAFLVVVVRDRLYTQDLSDLDYILDLLELPDEAA
jgi:biopolymer transport protein ExbB/TolQ